MRITHEDLKAIWRKLHLTTTEYGTGKSWAPWPWQDGDNWGTQGEELGAIRGGAAPLWHNDGDIWLEVMNGD